MPTTTHRTTLNQDQLRVLTLLHQFRFATSELIAQDLDKPSGVFVFKRLKILKERGLIGQRFDKSYRLAGKPAAYYLLPAGARALAEHYEQTGSKTVVNVRSIYKDGAVSETFIQHCLDVMTVRNLLRRRYGSRLRFFPKAALSVYEYFPQPLPDAFIRLKTSNGEVQCFVDACHESQPFVAVSKRVKNYVDYEEDGEWGVTGSPIPISLLICDGPKLERAIHRKLRRMASEADDMLFYTTTLDELRQMKRGKGDAIWRDVIDPEDVVALSEVG